MTTKKQDGVLHLEAHTKSIKRALKVVAPAWSDVDVHASAKESGEHGKTTVTYKHALDPAEHDSAVLAVGKQANIEEDHLLRDDDDSEDSA